MDTVVARNIGLAILVGFLALTLILYGALLLETLIFYPNFFHDVPRSLTVKNEFMAVRAPGNFFRPVGQALTLLALASVIAAWRVKAARYWTLAALAILALGEFLISMLYIWPRWTILNAENMAAHSPEYLQTVASEISTVHWIRVGLFTLVVVCVISGFLRFYRDRVQQYT
jgi:hypothetical protein